ncbi:MAG: GNAT family protein [Novosphingobium sp.]
MDRQLLLEGERLLLRPLHPDDWDALHAAARDPLIWDQHPDPDRWREPIFRDFFADALEAGGTLAILEKRGGAVIGSSQFANFKDGNGGAVEIGRTFLVRSHWGLGLNHELKRLMVGHALGEVATVYFRVGAENLRSRRAMEKIGARLTDLREDVTVHGRPVPHVIYEIGRDDFARGPLSS